MRTETAIEKANRFIEGSNFKLSGLYKKYFAQFVAYVLEQDEPSAKIPSVNIRKRIEAVQQSNARRPDSCSVARVLINRGYVQMVCKIRHNCMNEKIKVINVYSLHFSIIDQLTAFLTKETIELNNRTRKNGEKRKQNMSDAFAIQSTYQCGLFNDDGNKKRKIVAEKNESLYELRQCGYIFDEIIQLAKKATVKNNDMEVYQRIVDFLDALVIESNPYVEKVLNFIQINNPELYAILYPKNGDRSFSR